ncbi:MAG: metal-dependent transcriptional regulator [Acutalibacteraceae bacterium]|jgi:DtxR family Mn-dependent transcriptional regulator
MDKMQGFYTLKGYQLLEEEKFTSAMEDYLEMICRILQKNGYVKIRDLSANLNVRPSSSSKMVQQLNNLGYIKAERYGNISLTEKGKAAGEYLIYRHDVVHRFLCLLNNSENQLKKPKKSSTF